MRIAPRVILITVNYRGAKDTLRLIESVCQLEDFSQLRVVIVDNASDNNSVAPLRERILHLDNVLLLESETNRGYFGAAKWALARTLSESPLSHDWLIVCNNDVVIEDKRFIARLLERDPTTVGAIAPQIRSCLTGQDLNPALRRRPGRWKLLNARFWNSTYHVAMLRDWISSRKRSFFPSTRTPGTDWCSQYRDSSQHIYAPHGAFIIFSRQYFDKGGYIDDGFFLYGEEFSVAEICRHLGLPVVYDPALCVWHNEHGTMGFGLSRFAYDCQVEALKYIRGRYLNDIG